MKIRDAIMEIVTEHGGCAQFSVGEWANRLGNKGVNEFENRDVVAAFKELFRDGLLYLTKADKERLHASEYSGNSSDDSAFFYIGTFNAVTYPVSIMHTRIRRPIGFPI